MVPHDEEFYSRFQKLVEQEKVQCVFVYELSLRSTSTSAELIWCSLIRRSCNSISLLYCRWILGRNHRNGTWCFYCYQRFHCKHRSITNRLWIFPFPFFKPELSSSNLSNSPFLMPSLFFSPQVVWVSQQGVSAPPGGARQTPAGGDAVGTPGQIAPCQTAGTQRHEQRSQTERWVSSHYTFLCETTK